MDLLQLQEHLKAKGVNASDETVLQVLEEVGISLGEITPDILEVVVSDLSKLIGQGHAIATSKQKGAIAKSTSTGGKVAKGKGRKKAAIQPVSQEEELEVRERVEANLSGAVGRAIAEVEQVTQAVEQGADLATVSYGNRIYTALNNIGPDSINGAVAALMATEDRTAFFRSRVESIFADSISAFEAE